MQTRRPASDLCRTSWGAPNTLLTVFEHFIAVQGNTAAASAPKRPARKSRPAPAAPLLKSRVCGLRFRTIHGRYAANPRVQKVFRQRNGAGSWLPVFCHARGAAPGSGRLCQKFAGRPRRSLRRRQRLETGRISQGTGAWPSRRLGRKRRRRRSVTEPEIRERFFDRALKRDRHSVVVARILCCLSAQSPRCTKEKNDRPEIADPRNSRLSKAGHPLLRPHHLAQGPDWFPFARGSAL